MEKKYADSGGRDPSFHEASGIVVAAQLLTAIKDAIVKMKRAQKNDDVEQMVAAKREILSFQKKLEEIL